MMYYDILMYTLEHTHLYLAPFYPSRLSSASSSSSYIAPFMLSCHMPQKHLSILFIAALSNSQGMEPSTYEWMKRMWSTCTIESYSAIKKNKIVPFTGKWGELEGVLLSEITWAWQDQTGPGYGEHQSSPPQLWCSGQFRLNLFQRKSRQLWPGMVIKASGNHKAYSDLALTLGHHRAWEEW